MDELNDGYRLLRKIPSNEPSLLLLWLPVVVIGLAGVPLYISSLDQQVFVWLHQLGWYVHPALWQWLTVLGDGLAVCALMALLARRFPQLLWTYMIAVLLGTLWTHGLKWVLGGPRPAAVLDPVLLRVIGQVLEGNAFPSGHTLTIVGFCGIWILSIKKLPIKVALIALALTVSLSRLMVGAHWPTDVVYGALGGWLVAITALWISRRWQWGLRPTAQRLFTMLLLILSGVLIFHDAGYPASEWLLAGLGVMGVAASLVHLLNPTLVRRTADGTVYVYDSSVRT